MLDATHLGRRGFLASTVAGATLGGWLGRLAAQVPQPRPTKSCILLWMAGGPSHIDTFDPKPDAPELVRGEFRPIDTSVPGIRISEHFPRLARLMRHAAILRGMSTLESDHALATYHLHTGYQNRAGVVSFPSVGSIVSQELGQRDLPLPNFVCIGGSLQGATRSGFLGPDHQPLTVTDPLRGLDYIDPAAPAAQFDRQLRLLRQLEQASPPARQSPAAQAHQSVVDQTVRLMNARQKQAFDLALEDDAVRDAYGLAVPAAADNARIKSAVTSDSRGRTNFGQACLMARRLVETGVPFVEVVLDGWDTHRDNFPRTRALSLQCDAAMSTLVEELRQRQLLDSTLIVWMGEFGRTPQSTGGGRNHWARAWSTVLMGGGIQGGQIIGRTDQQAAAVVDRPISVTDFLGTVLAILGVDHTRENHPPGANRPIPIVDNTKGVNLIDELL